MLRKTVEVARGIGGRLRLVARLKGAGSSLLETIGNRRMFRRSAALPRPHRQAGQSNRERMNTALRAASISIFNQDLDLRYTWCHGCVLHLSWDEVLGKTDADLLDDPQDVAQLTDIKRWVLETGAGVRRTVSLQVRGQRQCYDLTIEPLRDAEGRVQGLTCVAADISDHRRTAEALHEQELMLAKAQQIANIGSWEIQVESRKVIWSEQMYRIFGLDPQQFAPTVDTVLPHIHPQDQHGLLVAILHAIRKGEPFCHETRVVRPDGASQTVLVQAERFVSHLDQPTRVIGTVLDITRRKLAEEQLRLLNETLEQRVAERTVIAEQRADQLRRLASQLTLAEQRERRRLAQLLHDHLQQLLVGAKFGIGIAKGQSQDASLLQSLKQVNEMLDQSIKVSRSLTVELSPPILYDGGLSAALHWLAGWMHEKYALRLKLTIDPKADPQGEDVRVLLFQAVRELLFNIVKHANVRCADLIMGRLNEDRVRIVVADGGIGFDPTRSAGEDGKGSGFGLFSIRERLEMLGGRMDITSSPGHGTQVTLLAPIQVTTDDAGHPVEGQHPKPHSHKSGSRTPPHTPHRVSGKAHRIRVLLADDHNIVRDGLASLLRTRKDIEVVGEASDGQAAVELACELHPDVVLMDVTMPRLTGVEATARITAESPHIHVIGLSMHTESDMAQAMRNAGAVAYLSKSCDPDTVIETIRQCAQPLSDSTAPSHDAARSAADAT